MSNCMLNAGDIKRNEHVLSTYNSHGQHRKSHICNLMEQWAMMGQHWKQRTWNKEFWELEKVTHSAGMPMFGKLYGEDGFVG